MGRADICTYFCGQQVKHLVQKSFHGSARKVGTWSVFETRSNGLVQRKLNF